MRCALILFVLLCGTAVSAEALIEAKPPVGKNNYVFDIVDIIPHESGEMGYVPATKQTVDVPAPVPVLSGVMIYNKGLIKLPLNKADEYQGRILPCLLVDIDGEPMKSVADVVAWFQKAAVGRHRVKVMIGETDIGGKKKNDGKRDLLFKFTKAATFDITYSELIKPAPIPTPEPAK